MPRAGWSAIRSKIEISRLDRSLTRSSVCCDGTRVPEPGIRSVLDLNELIRIAYQPALDPKASTS